MRKTIFLLFSPISISILALYAAHPALAHGDEPRLEINVERVQPGGVVEIRGVDFEPEELITLALTADGMDFPLGKIVADGEGIFLQNVTLPNDLREGVYAFRATTDDHEIISPLLTVFGAAISDGEGEQTVRDEDDPLLAPMPTFAPGVVPGGVSQAASHPSDANALPSRLSHVIVLLIALMLGILAGFGFRVRWRK